MELAMFVFLVLPILYPNGTLAGFAKATKTCPAAKWYWRPLNPKRSLPVLKWTSKSEYSLSFKFLFADIAHISGHHEQSLYPLLRMRGAW